MTSTSSQPCLVCGAYLSPWIIENGGFCNTCGMKLGSSGVPVFTLEELFDAVKKGTEGVNDLAEKVGMPLPNIERVFNLVQKAQAQASSGDELQASSGDDSQEVAADNSQQKISSPCDSPPSFINHPKIGLTTRVLTKDPKITLIRESIPIPALKFSYTNAFYHNQSGEISLLLSLEGEDSLLHDLKLTIKGDIARPFNVNMEDYLGLEKKIVVTPTVFPASSLKIHVSAFDATEEPHCWSGEVVIGDVEQTIEHDGAQHIHIEDHSSKNVGDKGGVTVSGMEFSQTLRRRQLAQPFKCEVIFNRDDVAERQLSISARADRIRAREIFSRARNRAGKGLYEKAYEHIREVEEIGFMLRDAQELRKKIEHQLSRLSLEKGEKLFKKGELKKAYEFLQERKGLIYNQKIIDLLIEIEDIGEYCKDALQLIEEDELEEALSLVEAAEKFAPLYERTKYVRQIYDAGFEQQIELNRQLEAEEEAAKVERVAREKQAKEREARKQKLALLEDEITVGIEEKKWRTVIRVVSQYQLLEGFSEQKVSDSLAVYKEAFEKESLSLRPMGRLTGSEENDPDILLIGESELTIGRDFRNAIVLVDDSGKTGRSHGRIVRSGKGEWQIQRIGGEYGSSVQPISLNSEFLELGSSSSLHDEDIVTFSGIVDISVKKNDSSLRLNFSRLAERDAKYLNLVLWVLMDSSAKAGGDSCSIPLSRCTDSVFEIYLSNDIFWISPVEGSGVSISIDDEPLIQARPLYHNEIILVGDDEYYFYQVRSEEELWWAEDELDSRWK